MTPLEGLPPPEAGEAGEILGGLEAEVAEGVRLYWDTAAEVLEGSGVALLDLPAELVSLRRNFFSALFLHSYVRAGIPRARRVAYAAVNHCLRGMVTGCDNILDDEYKPTLLTDLPQAGVRFRSVLDIMTADRVLMSLLLRRLKAAPEQALRASRASLAALTRSGAQEAEEEAGVESEPLRPEEILSSVHHLKTGVLFQSPWAVPGIFEERAASPLARELADGLYRIGMGCQILDDMVDLGSDLARRRHNYVASLAWHGPAHRERERVAARSALDAADLPVAARAAASKATDLLESGLGVLFEARHGFLVQPAAAFLVRLIGADRFMDGAFSSGESAGQA